MERHRALNEEPEQPAHNYVAQHVQEHYTPRPSQPLPRTPSPAVRSVQRDESPAVQRREEVALPRIDTSARIRRPEDPPTGIPKHDPSSASDVFADVDTPTEQANTGRKLDSAAQPTPIDVMVSPKMAANQDSSYPRLATTPQPTTTNTLAGQGRGSMRVQHDRGSSLSPGRNAHFAPVAVELSGVKHQPPPRSISPAKSALKSSPSVSRRGTSPVSQNGRLLSQGTPSEVSDTTSEAGKKRSVRVSFEEEPIVAKTSAPTEAEPPTAPKGLAASQWSPKTEKENEFEDFMKPRAALPVFGSIRDKERRSQEEVPEKVTETVSSTPMTASVGSVGEPLQASSDHGIARIVADDHAQKQTSPNDPLPPQVTTVEGTGYVSDSSDEADRSSSEKHGALDDSSQILPVPEPKSLTTPPREEKLATPSSIKENNVEVPDIALLPATPSPYEKPEPLFQPLVIPGGWNDDVADTEEQVKAAPVPTTKQREPAPAVQPTLQPTTLHELVTRDVDEESSDDNSSVYSDAYEDLDDGGFASIDALVESPVAKKSGGLMFSKYADKNATEPATSGLRNETVVDDAPEPAATQAQDWDAARQHWSGINEARKSPQSEVPPVLASSKAEDVAARVMTAPVKQEQPKTQRKVETQPARVQSKPVTAQSQVAQSPSKPLKSALKKTAAPQPAPATQSQPRMQTTMRNQNQIPRDDRAAPQMRTSMRGPPGRDSRSPESHMRTSMRTGPPPAPREQPQMRTSMRGASPAAAGLAASRHSMPPMDQKPPRAALQKKHIPAGAVAAKPRPQSMAAVPMKQAPAPTYDSDSDGSASSFQRARGRRSGKQNDNRYTMRASMRQDAAPTMRAAAPVPKAIRSISPPGSPSPAMRKSMRPSSPTPERPKSSKFSIRSLSPMGRFRNSKPIEAAPPEPTRPRTTGGLSKQSKQKAPVSERTKPAFSSRFADSSDEEDVGRPSRFQSRFADSDDDEPGYSLPQGLTPVRGIPKKAGEEDGDSTDLEEELEDAPAPAAAVPETVSGANGASNGQANGKTNGEGSILANGSLRDSKHATLPSFEGGGKTKAKRGFFGLGKKKIATSPASAPQSTRPSTDITETTKAASFDIPAPPLQRNRDQNMPLTPIDEDKDFYASANNSPQVARSPKLQRRSTPEWPLPHNNIPVPPIPDDNARPMSSDGIAPRRPRFAMRQGSQMSNVTAPDTTGRSVSYGKGGKKKKFQGLRRVFGLND